MRYIFLLCAGLALAGCQTKQLPPVATVSCPSSLMQSVEAQPLILDIAASMTFADTPEAQSGGNAYLDYVSKLAAWGRSGWSRAETAKRHCEGK